MWEAEPLHSRDPDSRSQEGKSRPPGWSGRAPRREVRPRSELGEYGGLGEPPDRTRGPGRRPYLRSSTSASLSSASRSNCLFTKLSTVADAMAAVRPGPGAAEVPSRRVPAAARGGAPGRARCVDAPGSRLFRFRCRSRLREDGGGCGGRGCGGLGPAGHFQTAGVCMQPQCPESVGARRG